MFFEYCRLDYTQQTHKADTPHRRTQPSHWTHDLHTQDKRSCDNVEPRDMPQFRYWVVHSELGSIINTSYQKLPFGSGDSWEVKVMIFLKCIPVLCTN